jgi:hypothetical protein
MNTAAEAIEFIHRIPSPAFKIILDVKAMCSMGKPIPDIIRESWPEFSWQCNAMQCNQFILKF